MLSGGQYDKLMKKMNRTAGAIGFAVYTDLLQRLVQSNSEYDVDVLLLYTGEATPDKVNKQVREYTDKGLSVMVQRVKPETVRYRQLVTFNGSEVQTLENNA